MNIVRLSRRYPTKKLYLHAGNYTVIFGSTRTTNVVHESGIWYITVKGGYKVK
jgi:hypothetical protein